MISLDNNLNPALDIPLVVILQLLKLFIQRAMLTHEFVIFFLKREKNKILLVNVHSASSIQPYFLLCLSTHYC